jgi:hypothetical protein
MSAWKKKVRHVYEEGRNVCWKASTVIETKRDTTYGKYKESAHMSLVDNPLWTQLGHPSHLDSNNWSRSRETTTTCSVKLVVILSCRLGIARDTKVSIKKKRKKKNVQCRFHEKVMEASYLKVSRHIGGTYHLHLQGRISRPRYRLESRWQVE